MRRRPTTWPHLLEVQGVVLAAEGLQSRLGGVGAEGGDGRTTQDLDTGGVVDHRRHPTQVLDLRGHGIRADYRVHDLLQQRPDVLPHLRVEHSQGATDGARRGDDVRCAAQRVGQVLGQVRP